MYAIKQRVGPRAQQRPSGPRHLLYGYAHPWQGFRKYYQRAWRGGAFIRSRVHSVEQVPGSHDLALRYLSEDGVLQTESLIWWCSPWDEVSPEAVALADTLGIDLQPETGLPPPLPLRR